jgi:ssDNA-binding Zn-finger/Zn-ribbon topoisomerase 1
MTVMVVFFLLVSVVTLALYLGVISGFALLIAFILQHLFVFLSVAGALLIASFWLRELFIKVGWIEGPPKCPHGVEVSNRNYCASCLAEVRERALGDRREARRWNAKRRLQMACQSLRRSEIKRLALAWKLQSGRISSMEPREFENAVAAIFRKLGYEVEQTPFSNDGGKDAVLKKGGRKYVVECKRYEATGVSGRRDLQILLAAKHDVQADEAIFITTGKFAKTASEYANENGIILYDGDHLPILVNQAYPKESTMPFAEVMCEECGETVTFDVFAVSEGSKACKNSHEVSSNIKLEDLEVVTSLNTPVCPEHKLLMRAVRTRYKTFWGCPEYPKCKIQLPYREDEAGGNAGLSNKLSV